VLGLVLILLLIWFVVTVILAAGTLFFQGYIYSEPAGSMYWRAPAAGAVVTAFLALWMFFDYRAPERYRELHGFSATETREPFKLLRDGKNKEYRRQKDATGHPVYLFEGRPGKQNELPGRLAKVIAIEGDKEYVFEPLRDDKGKYEVDREESVRYRNKETGWEMTDAHMGQVYIFHPGWLLGNLLLNFLHLVVWFLCLWLLLRYQWSHALGLAVVCWAVMTLLVLPMVLTRTEAVAKQRATPAAAAPVQTSPAEPGKANRE
jgi:hypothetical protein